MNTLAKTQPVPSPYKKRWLSTVRKDFVKRKWVYLMVLPVLAYYLIFHYWPMYGALIAFKSFSPAKGVWNSPWVGFQHFMDFFNSYYFWRLLRNTVLINVYDILFHFPMPILFALLLNEIKNSLFRRTIQTVTYLPHFVSLVVICGIVANFLTKDGAVNDIIAFLGGERTSFLLKPEWFRTIYIGSSIWQQLGWGSIIYLAALSSIDPQLYEASIVDGAGRFKQLLHITIPGLIPTITIMLILRMGQMINVGSEKVLLLYNSSIYETADVISTFIYRKGLLEANYSYSTAVGLFNSAVNFALVILANKISRSAQKTSLW